MKPKPTERIQYHVFSTFSEFFALGQVSLRATATEMLQEYWWIFIFDVKALISCHYMWIDLQVVKNYPVKQLRPSVYILFFSPHLYYNPYIKRDLRCLFIASISINRWIENICKTLQNPVAIPGVGSANLEKSRAHFGFKTNWEDMKETSVTLRNILRSTSF